MTIIFDIGLSTQRSIEIDFFTEQLIDNRLNANWEKVIDNESQIPNVSAFENNKAFSTLEIRSNGLVIPVQGNYNNISYISSTYTEENRTYSISLILDHSN